MDDYEKRIREKVFESGILTNGEWVYLIGVFNAAREYELALDKTVPVTNGIRGGET